MTSRWPRAVRSVHLAVALVAATAVIAVLGSGFGALPALAPALLPGTGVWAAAADSTALRAESIDLDGLQGTARVSFDPAGVPSVTASSDVDLFEAQGYLQARFRLGQLDLERRLATGRLSELVGPSGLESDTLELRLGLGRTAQQEWAETPAGSPAAVALTAFTRGVNDRIAEVRRSGGWPVEFTLAGVFPRDWTPVDSLAVQGLLSQELAYSTSALDYAVLSAALGPQRTADWFPVVAGTAQHPYDPGPYRDLGTDPLPGSTNATAGPVPTNAASVPAAGVPAAAILQSTRHLPPAQLHAFPDSNAWAVNGPAVAGGGAILAGDPHLQQSLPSYWYQIALDAPGITASGASLVGLPGVVIGRNAHVAWSITALQAQATLFYSERTDPAHPDQYFWNGAWRPLGHVRYAIPVHGATDVPLTVDTTVHGPVMTQVGRTTSVDWTGDLPSADLAAILRVDGADDAAQLRAALRDWRSPGLNFVYATDAGDIGAQAAGAVPITGSPSPGSLLRGTGEDDVRGAIPFDALPHVENPPDHVVVSANQRPTTDAYPYYLGTTFDDFDPGYRAVEAAERLTAGPVSTKDVDELQKDVTDPLAAQIVPRLLAATAARPHDPTTTVALGVLAHWDHRMTADSASAAMWWTFWQHYLHAVFDPWWQAAHVPVDLDPDGLVPAPALVSLDQDLEEWTLNDPGNPAFRGPDGAARDSGDLMATAFDRTVHDLVERSGADPTAWRWGGIHTREIPSTLGLDALGSGTVPGDGDPWTIDAADGGEVSSFGPTWRMVIHWTGAGRAESNALYPGGQSDDPSSPLYRTFLDDWWSERLRPMPLRPVPAPDDVVWTLNPGGEGS